MAGVVHANGNMSFNQSGEDDIRRFRENRNPMSFGTRNEATMLEVAA
jgi:hypothetical protein